MLRFLRLPTRRHVRRGIQFLSILSMGACTEQCEDPLGPDFQANLVGSVTLNGEGVEGVPVSAGSYGSATTRPSGSYGITMQGDSETFLPCVTLGGAYGVAQEATVTFSCPIVSEGATRTEDFAFEHAPPTLQIASPQDGAVLPDGSGTRLRATATTTLRLNGRSAVFPLEVSWSSSLDGALVEALPLSAAPVDLSDGSHVLTATLVDWFGFSVSDAVTVQVGSSSNEDPTATISSPPSGGSFNPGESVQFTGTGTDPEDGTLTGASLAWTSSQEGAIGTGASFSRVMAEGSHIVTLTVTDSQGATDSETVSILVRSATGTGSIQGVVSIGPELLPFIPVTLSGAASGSTQTNAQGSYTFTDLGPGTYTITITPPPGADIGTARTVTLGDGEALTVNFSG